MHWDDSPGLTSYRPPNLIGAHRISIGIDIREDRAGSGITYRQRRGDESIRGCNDLVAGPYPEAAQSEHERVRTAGDADPVTAAAQAAKSRLEFRHLASEYKVCVPENPFNRRQYLAAQGGVLFFQVY